MPASPTTTVYYLCRRNLSVYQREKHSQVYHLRQKPKSSEHFRSSPSATLCMSSKCSTADDGSDDLDEILRGIQHVDDLLDEQVRRIQHVGDLLDKIADMERAFESMPSSTLYVAFRYVQAFAVFFVVISIWVWHDMLDDPTLLCRLWAASPFEFPLASDDPTSVSSLPLFLFSLAISQVTVLAVQLVVTTAARLYFDNVFHDRLGWPRSIGAAMVGGMAVVGMIRLNGMKLIQGYLIGIPTECQSFD
ncbi:hypothetical protein K402DRAFT_403712 [Aulographum hederae CBS 113979]|uniref:Uncharacterized protein n=1 Tax=Aulographum hederae CBS 113979 TaxID=1176131 RepID=A0A6G1H1T1_9PEZI|nr:hypothetical protein K402DRAFT_403712 [Aulographum hederae CBS 113979]